MNRPERAVREIRDLPPIDSAHIGRYLEEQGGGLCAETHVHVFRELRRIGAVDTSRTTAELLFGRPLANGQCIGGHCEPTIRQAARGFGFASDPRLLEEFRQRCYERVLEALLAGTDAKPFWEERFFLALKNAAIDVGREMKRERGPPPPGDRGDLAKLEPIRADEEDSLLSELTVDDIRRAINRLPRRRRMAAWLRWVKEYPIECQDPTETSVSGLMGITPRMVRKHLSGARDMLQMDPSIAELARGTGESRLEA